MHYLRLAFLLVAIILFVIDFLAPTQSRPARSLGLAFFAAAFLPT